ncbi:MAG TPA: hypothetical protein VIJ26_06850, partial [Thermoanaerobaculia bacterium]
MNGKAHRGPAAVCLGLLLLSALPVLAVPQEKPAPPQPAPALRQFEVRRSATPVKIDGVLDEDVWKTATVVDLPYEWFPGDNTTPPVKTEALITYDGDNLYVA